MASRQKTKSAAVVLVTNQKGGSAKSTTAMNLAMAFHVAGKNVLLGDADPQNTLLSWYGQADEDDRIPIPYINLAEPGLDVATELEQRQHEYDYIIIDGRPDLRIDTSALFYVSDLVVIPLQASMADLHSTEVLVRDIRVAQEKMRPDLKFALVLTMTSSNRLLLKFTKDTIEQRGYPIFKTSIARRECQAHVYALGKTVFDSGGASFRAAADEARKLAAEVAKTLSR